MVELHRYSFIVLPGVVGLDLILDDGSLPQFTLQFGWFLAQTVANPKVLNEIAPVNPDERVMEMLKKNLYCL